MAFSEKCSVPSRSARFSIMLNRFKSLLPHHFDLTSNWCDGEGLDSFTDCAVCTKEESPITLEGSLKSQHRFFLARNIN